MLRRTLGTPTLVHANWQAHCRETADRPAFMLTMGTDLFGRDQVKLVGPDGPVDDSTACLILAEALNEIRRRDQAEDEKSRVIRVAKDSGKK